MKHLLLFATIAVALPVSVAVAGMLSGHVDVPRSSLSVDVSGSDVAHSAEGFITDLTSEGIGFLADDGMSDADRKAGFKKLLNNNFDMNTIARFSLGSNWRNASKAQQDEYLGLFKAMIVNVYSERFNNYSGQKLSVTGSRAEGGSDILVHSLMTQASGPKVKIDWRVRDRSGKFQVVDVIVEGVSMAMTQRSDFSSVIQRGGGDIEALLAHLRKS